MITGGCLCGDVRYEADGEPYARTVCHCSSCRRASGAPMVAWFNVKAEDLTISGALTDYRSGEAVRRFCNRCGAQVLLVDDRDPGEVEVALATLDDPECVTPDKHIWVRSRLDWIKLGDALPKFAMSSVGVQPVC